MMTIVPISDQESEAAEANSTSEQWSFAQTYLFAIGSALLLWAIVGGIAYLAFTDPMLLAKGAIGGLALICLTAAFVMGSWRK